MDCEDAWNLMSAKIDGALEANQGGELEAHLEACAACRSILDATRREDAAMLRAFEPGRVRAEAALESVAGRLDSPRPRRAWLPRVLEASMAAAAGFVVAAILVGKPVEPQGTPSTPVSFRPSAISGRLTVAEGRVEVLLPAASAWLPLGVESTIPPGARLRSGPEAGGEVVTPDGSVLFFGEGTELAFLSARALELVSGRLWTSVAHGESPFEVETPGARVRALGTRFDLLANREASVLTVVEGTVLVLAREGSRVVRRGEMTRIAAGRVDPPRRADDRVLATNWIHRWLARGSPGTGELESRLEDLLAIPGEAKTGLRYEREIRSLGPRCAQLLLRFLLSPRSDAEPERRRRAAAIAGALAEKSAVGDLIRVLADPDGEVRASGAEALLRLTGESQGSSLDTWRGPWSACEPVFEAWLAWWTRHGSEYSAR